MSTPIISPRSPKTNKIIRNPIFVSDAEESKRSDCELGIFDAEKYYKAELNTPPAACDVRGGGFDSRKRSLSVLSYKKKSASSISGTSISSGSSMNSRSFLLHNRKSDRMTILASAAMLFGKCCCRGKNSVDAVTGNSIKRQETKTRIDYQSSKMEYNFENPELRMHYINFPILNPTTGNQADAGGIHRRIWSHDKIPENSISTGESDTDSSSDLFEIDILPGGNCYPPSEASIEWSVVTASAAEFSVASDSDELRQKAAFSPPKTKLEASKSGLLSACRNEKAVGIVEDAHRAQSFRKSHEEKKLKRESFNALHQMMV